MDRLGMVRPQVKPPLGGEIVPAALMGGAAKVAAQENGTHLTVALERPDDTVSRYDMPLFPSGHPLSQANLFYAERIFKFLLWQRGGYRAYVGGPEETGKHIQRLYSPKGARAFDARMMKEIYGEPFQVVPCGLEEVPPARERFRPLGGHLDGYRIGFDLGASDIKVAALIDGEPVFSEEIIWEPTREPDPAYHYQHILGALKRAATHLPRVDAIGGSAAGVYVDNRVRVASLFRGVPKERCAEVRDLFVRLGEEMGIPLVIVNDGEVAALAGALSLGVKGLLGIAMGSSEAAGYVTPEGTITGWLNELAFAPIDYSPDAPVDEWSEDRGCGASYLSQQAVFRLATEVGLKLPQDFTKAERLKAVQGLLSANDPKAEKIWQTIGIYAGYALAHYLEFYQAKHILLLGRVTSGRGGELILEWAERVLETEFPELYRRVQLHLPDEKARRMGQAIAAASLPALE